MRPDAQPPLYGPGRPVVRPRETGVAVLAGVLWAVVLALVTGLGFLVAFVAMWTASEGEPVGDFVLPWLVAGLVTAAVPTALFCTPAVRRRTVPRRALLTGAVTCPVAIGLSIWAQVATR
ncbi:hypothetical protein ACIGEZ_31040 [Streptomyces sp. NPDC085481]|uniref:hypothetical protein n=1 Tax=Streptomyces sp. NPDC085481 TaxID=3365727 RepID=UPI0037D689B5